MTFYSKIRQLKFLVSFWGDVKESWKDDPWYIVSLIFYFLGLTILLVLFPYMMVR